MITDAQEACVHWCRKFTKLNVLKHRVTGGDKTREFDQPLEGLENQTHGIETRILERIDDTETDTNLPRTLKSCASEK
jgi:hypothetical protein